MDQNALQDLPIKVVDLAVLVILLGSGLLAFARGFVRELLSIVAWVGAILIALRAMPYALPYARQYVEYDLVADGITFFVLFVVALSILSFIGHLIVKRAKASGMNFLDRTLGFIFGLARGAVIACIAYLVISLPVGSEDRPQWLEEARVLPLLVYGGERLKELAPEGAFESARAGAETVKDAAARKALEELSAEEAFKQLLNPKPRDVESAPDSGGETGYKPDERRQIDQLIQSNEPKPSNEPKQ